MIDTRTEDKALCGEVSTLPSLLFCAFLSIYQDDHFLVYVSLFYLRWSTHSYFFIVEQ